MQPNFEPFMGRIIVEVVEDDVESYLKEMYGVTKDSKLALPEEVLADKVPITKGKILKISKNSFGSRFKEVFGPDMANEGSTLEEGDLIYFVRNQTMSIDPKRKYHIVNDEHIVGYIKKDKVEVNNE